MPKVRPLTEAQRREQFYQERLKWMADGLAVYKNRNRLTNAEVASALSIGVNTVAKVLNADEVKLSTKDMLRLKPLYHLLRNAADEGLAHLEG